MGRHKYSTICDGGGWRRLGEGMQDSRDGLMILNQALCYACPCLHLGGCFGGLGRHLESLCCAQSLQLCPILCDPVDCSPPGSSVHGILQARILEWVAMPSFRGCS